MSYCVNCGVELDPSLKKCPLCNTLVINPNTVPSYETASPYPEKKGPVDTVKKKDIALLISIFLLTTAITCGVLNFMVFPDIKWSFIVIGFCFLLWVFCLPFLIYKKTSPYLAEVFDGLASIIFMGLIAKLTGSNEWLTGLGIPIIVLITIVVLWFTLCMRNFRVSILTTVLYIFIAIPVICVGIELICRYYLGAKMIIVWSAVVLTVCVIFIAVVITMLLVPRLREAARRRLHF